MTTVVICGSRQDPDRIRVARAAEEAAARVVLADPTQGATLDDAAAYRLWRAHIQNADEALIVPRPDGTLGVSTLGELSYALLLGRTVRIYLGTVHSGLSGGRPPADAAADGVAAPLGCVLPGGPEYADLPDCEACGGMGKDRAAVDAWYESAPSPAEVREVLGMARHGEQQRRAEALARGDDLAAHYPQVSADGREVAR